MRSQEVVRSACRVIFRRRSGCAFVKRAFSSPFGQKAGWNVAGTAAGRLIGPLAQIVIARFLEPSQFGLFALGMAWVAFYDVIKDLGLNHAVIVDDTDEDFAGLQFSIELSLAAILFLITLAGAPFLERWMGHEDLATVLIAMSLLMFVYAVADPLVTRYMKAQEYRVLAIRQMVIPVIMGLVGIALVWQEFGVFALVGGVIAGHLTGCVWLVMADRRLTLPRWDAIGFVRLFKLGKHIFLQRVAGYLTTHADSFIVGGQLGAAQLGVYRLGNQLAFLLPTLAVSPVGQVAFTDIADNRDTEHLSRRYYQYTYFTGISMLAYAVVVYLSAPLVIPAVLGEQWERMVPVVQLFCLVMATGFMSAINADIAKVLGFAGVYTRFTFIRSGLTLLALMLAATISLQAVVIAWVVAGIIANLVNEIIFYRVQGVVLMRPAKAWLIAAAWLWALLVLVKQI